MPIRTAPTSSLNWAETVESLGPRALHFEDWIGLRHQQVQREKERATGPRAILHIGTMKTGTSTLQAALSKNFDYLGNAGFRYLGWPLRTASRLEEQLRSVDQGMSIVVSDEGLWHFSGTTRSDTRAIAEVLRGYNVSIVVYFRRPDEYVESWYSQGLKTGLGAPRLSQFLASGFVNSRGFSLPSADGNSRPDPGVDHVFDSQEFMDHIDLSILPKLRYFREVFPTADIIVRPYERSQLRAGDIVVDFFDSVGLVSAASRAQVRRFKKEFNWPANQNVSPGADTVLMANLLRRVYEVPDAVVEAFLESHSPPAMLAAEKRRILRLHEANALNARMRPIFRTVQATFGGGGCEEFFLNWQLVPEEFRQSSIRDIYDNHIGTGSSDDS